MVGELAFLAVVDGPRGLGFVLGSGGNGLAGDGEEFAAQEPADAGLRGAFGDADIFGEFAVADGDGATAALLFGGDPEIDEEAGGAAVAADEIAEECVDNVVVELGHDVCRRLRKLGSL